MSKITYEKALEIWNDRSNGADEGRSTSKGGRAWLSGEFLLSELEALCLILRHEAGERVEGLPELLRNMQPIPEMGSLSTNQRAIVEYLENLDPDYAVTFSNIESNCFMNTERARTVTRALARKGITEHVLGCMTDQGEVCGSGYRLSAMGRQMVRIYREGGEA